MKKQQVYKNEIKLIGIQVRTNNKSEMNPSEAKIGDTAQRYFSKNLASLIPMRKNPGITFCAYTNYESDHTGNYTYFIGEEVTDLSDIPEGYTYLTVPKGNYIQLTSSSGVMPDIVIKLWQKIWQMNSEELGGKRSYTVDYEIYDEKAIDPKNTIVDIYIGI